MRIWGCYQVRIGILIVTFFRVPNDVIMKQLVPSNSTLMNERWPHRYPNSEKYIELLIQLNGGLGLFDRDNDEIVGWVLKNEFAGVG